MIGLVSVDIPKLLIAKGGVASLSNDELVETCLVLLTTKHEYESGLAYLQDVRDRGICFSEFYNLAKNKWSTQSLARLMARVKTNEKLFRFLGEFDEKARVLGFSETSAPRQKGRIFLVLYAYYFDKYSFAEISLSETRSLHSLVKNMHLLFSGERPPVENASVRKDLAGILCFIQECYKSNRTEVPQTLISEIIPAHLIKERGRTLSALKRKNNDSEELSYSFIFASFEGYKKTLLLKNPKDVNASFRALLKYIKEHLQINEIKTIDDFSNLIVSGRTGQSRWLHYLENVVKTQVKSKATYIRDFIVWVMLEYAIDIDDGYEPFLSRLETEKVFRMQNRVGGSKDETPKALFPYRVHQISTEILLDTSYKWAKTLPHLYFENTFGAQVFNPTIINLMALLFTVPIRGIQAQCLDSGEGDPYKYNFKQSIWEQNDGAHTNYWKAKGSSNKQRGFLCRDNTLVSDARKSKDFDKDGKPVVRRAYMYINTNKTADRNVAFSDTSGYVIPWHHSEVISIVQRQWDFINEHHPVSKPSDFRELNPKEIKQILGAEPTDAVKNLIPSRFYLFRCNLNPVKDSWDFPPTKALLVKTWNALMLEIQRRLDEEGADYSVVSAEKFMKFNNNIGGGNSYISYLTIHCTRVTGITRLEESGVPIHIISKFIAGHGNIRTTYRYTKHDRQYVNQQITDAQSKISRNMQISLTSELKKSSIEEAKVMAYIPDIYSTYWEVVKERAWNSNTLGVCPNAGTLCDEALKDN
ncbi:hypothetical protein H5071_08320, partial [Shewanella sp. SR41-2]|nr:hypothetical protein [Shewanella sp. SR41-2]